MPGEDADVQGDAAGSGATEAELTLHEAAQRLGVHYMTAYRYVRLGLLAAHKVGMTWRVRPADLERFAARGRGSGAAGPGGAEGPVAPEPDGATAPAGRRRVSWPDRFGGRVLAGDRQGAWGVVEAALASGMTPADVYLDVLAPTLVDVGRRWAEGELDVAEEHQATGIVWSVVGRLSPRFVRRGPSRGVIVLGAVAGDQHGLAVALLADLLRGAGFEVHDLGADTPASSFAFAARRCDRLVAVGLSATRPGNAEALVEAVRAVREAVGPGVAVVVGGGGVRGPEEVAALGVDGYARDGRSAVALFEALAGGPVTPPG